MKYSSRLFGNIIVLGKYGESLRAKSLSRVCLSNFLRVQNKNVSVYVCMFNKIITTFLFSVKLLYMKRHKTSVYVSRMYAIYD